MVVDLPFAWCEVPDADPRFSLSDENDAAGEGDSEPRLSSRVVLGRTITESSSSSGRERFARRAMLEKFRGNWGGFAFK